MAIVLKYGVYFACALYFFVVEIRPDAYQIVHVNDLGVHGALFAVEEESLLEVMQKRLLDLQASGQLTVLQDKMVEYAQQKALAPTRVQHLTKTTKKRVYRYDPTLVMESDMVIAKIVHGKEVVIARKGDRVNPLDTVSLTRGLLFIDGDDEAQLKLIEAYSKHFDIVLVGGKPIDIQRQYNVPMFFDQGGILSKRFGIQHVPAKIEQVSQKDRYVQITEFKP